MTINQSGMQSQLETLFTHPPATIAACAQGWAGAVQTGTAAVVPASLTVGAAGATLSTQLGAAFAKPNAIPDMELAFTAFGVAVGGGMAPLYTATPPPGPVGFATLCSNKDRTHAQAAAAFAAAIATWLKTGKAALTAPPNTVVPWT